MNKIQNKNMPDESYKLPKVENALNKVLRFIYYYRLVFVVLALAGISYLDYKVWINYSNDDQLKNTALVLTCGSIIIGIFYSIINYEHNQLKFKHEKKASRELLTFTTASKMHENEIMTNFKSLRAFYAEHTNLFLNNNHNDIEELWKEKPGIRMSFIIIFNYLEAISIAIEQGIVDENFMKEFFKTIFMDYQIKYGTYIEHLRVVQGSQRIYRNFIKVANRWKDED